MIKLPRFLAAAIATALSLNATAADLSLLNVSYDSTREFYAEFNREFEGDWKEKTGKVVEIKQSHGGSGKQALAVIDGLAADVVTLALGYDIDAIHEKAGLLPTDWQSRLPNNSSPFTSVIVFLVRKGNPKNIKDWSDLIRKDVQVITPNPKTSGGARWNYLGAWAFARQQYGSDEKAKEFMRALFRNVRVPDPSARGAIRTFVQRGMGDVLLSWESEALLVTKESGEGQFEIVMPSMSIQAEPPVAWLDQNTEKHGTTEVAKAYLQQLYAPAAQEMAARHHFRPSDPNFAAKFAAQFPQVKLVTITQEFGGWSRAQKAHFDDGGSFDQISNQ